MKRNETAGRRIHRPGMTGALVLVLPMILAVGAAGRENAEFELTAVSGVGIGDLGRRLDGPTWGGSFYGGWQVPGSSFIIGGRLAMSSYGSEHSADLAGFSDAVPADVRYNYNLLLTHLVLRYQPRPALFTPFVEASLGLSYFFTQAYHGNGNIVPIMVGDTFLTIDGDGSETLMSSLTPSLGLGAGLKVRLARIGGGGQADRPPLSVFLDLQGRYLCGGTARYLKPGGLTLDGRRLASEPQRSRTDMFFISLGLSIGGSFR